MTTAQRVAWGELQQGYRVHMLPSIQASVKKRTISLRIIDNLVDKCTTAGIPYEQIVIEH